MIPQLEGGLLPPGRFRASTDEVAQRFVAATEFQASATRAQCWADLEALVALIKKRRVRVPAAFVGGSFVSDVLDPGDLDATLLVDASRISNPATLSSVVKVVRNAKPSGLNLDAFLIFWRPEADEQLVPLTYLQERGKWDDWWQRHVAKPDRATPVRAHAMPVCGYLEVMFDGYQ